MSIEQAEKINSLATELSSYLKLRANLNKPELCQKELEDCVCLLQEVLSTIYVKPVEVKKEKQKRNLSTEERQRRSELGEIVGKYKRLKTDTDEEKKYKEQQKKTELDAHNAKWASKKLELESGKLVKVSH